MLGAEILECVGRYWKAFHFLCAPLLQCHVAATQGRCFTAHGTANDPAKQIKRKQWDTLLKPKTSQDTPIVSVYHADVKTKPDPAETL